MVTNSIILAWRILWTEEPSRLQSTGLQKSQRWLKRLSTHKRGRGQGLAPAHQQSWQALLHPSLLSAECENPNVRASCAFSFLIVDDDLWGCHSGVRQLCKHIFTLTVTHAYTSRHMPTDMPTLAHEITNTYKHPVMCSYIYTKSMSIHIWMQCIYTHGAHIWSCPEIFSDCLLANALLAGKGHQNDRLEEREGRPF